MYTKLPETIVEKIKKEVEIIKKQYELDNPIIRNDIFYILDQLCIVLRYPLEQEEVNGIHMERWINGEKKDFVFINTANAVEKQIYTAAHELGHVWKIDEKILASMEEEADPEAIINRFAAELLMPEEIFIKFFLRYCLENGATGNAIDEMIFIKILVSLMDTFMVPYKSVVYRLEEIDYIDEKNRKKLEKIEENDPEKITACAQAEDCQNIFQINKQKSMSDLYNMLEFAEEKEILSEKKLERIREQFGYSKRTGEKDTEEKISIQNILGE